MTSPRRVPAPDPGRAHRANLPGLPAERTRLAWDRTAIGLGAHAAVLLLHNGNQPGPLRLTIAALSVGLAGFAVLAGVLRARRVQPGSQRPPAPTAMLVALAAGIATLGVLDLVAIAVA